MSGDGFCGHIENRKPQVPLIEKPTDSLPLKARETHNAELLEGQSLLSTPHAQNISSTLASCYADFSEFRIRLGHGPCALQSDRKAKRVLPNIFWSKITPRANDARLTQVCAERNGVKALWLAAGNRMSFPFQEASKILLNRVLLVTSFLAPVVLRYPCSASGLVFRNLSVARAEH